jgi:hypothetical protein
MVGWVMVAYEENREGVEDFVGISTLTFCLSVDISQCVPDSVICIFAGQTSVDEVVKHIYDY